MSVTIETLKIKYFELLKKELEKRGRTNEKLSNEIDELEKDIKKLLSEELGTEITEGVVNKKLKKLKQGPYSEGV